MLYHVSMIIYQCTPTRRIIQHDEEHYDIETLFTINPQPGVVEEVWAVIECGITGEDEMEYTRCEEGQRLAKEYVANYDKVLKEGGDWMAAFADGRVHDHTETCTQCQNYIAARRGNFVQIEEEQSIDTGLIVLNETYRPATNDGDMPF